MLLQFDVLVSSNIRRKKPWPNLKWIGKQKESVCLLDKKRASVLYLPSGRTKRVLPFLKPYLKELVYIGTSQSGEFMVGLLDSGKLVLWCKDTNVTTVIPQCPDFIASDLKKINCFVSNDGSKIILVVNNHKVVVWEQGNGLPLDNEGRWSSVSLNLDQKSLAFKETSVAAIFFTNLAQGECCMCSFVCNNGAQMIVSNLLLTWQDEVQLNQSTPNFSSSASYNSYELNEFNPVCKPVRIRGAYLTRISHNAQILAIAINQRQPYQTQMMFHHPYTATSVVANLQGLGSKGDDVLAQFAKTYWVVDMTWSYDDLFLACITGRGSLFLLSRMGEPLMIATHKQGIEFGPSIFIPLLPLIEHPGKENKGPAPNERPGSPTSSLVSSVLSEDRSWKQRFSVTAHPRLPILLCSNGYMVTALQISEFIRPRDVATLSLVECSRRLRKMIGTFKLDCNSISTPRYELPNTLFEQPKFKEHRLTRLYNSLFKRKKRDKKVLTETQNIPEDSFTKDEDVKKLEYRFEEEEMDGNAVTSDEDTENKENPRKPFGAVHDADHGKITFADLSLTLDPTDLDQSAIEAVDGESLIKAAKKSILQLCTSWALIVSEEVDPGSLLLVDARSKSSDELHDFFLHTLATLCSVLTECQKLAHCLPWTLQEGHHHDKTEGHLRDVLRDLVATLGDRVVALAAWGAGKSPLVSRSAQILLQALLSGHRLAPEGCSSVSEICENFSEALRFLLKGEDMLYRVCSFHEQSSVTSEVGHPVTCRFKPLDVAPLQMTERDSILVRKLHLYPAWKNLYKFLCEFYDAVPSVQADTPTIRLLSFLQRLLLRSMTLDLDPGPELPTVLSMIALLGEYRLDSSLELAAGVLEGHFTKRQLWKEETWKAVELLCSSMVAYFTDDVMRFTTHEPMKRSLVMNRDLVTEAIRKQKLSYSWSASHAVSLLLCSGRVPEASILAQDVGDWRTSVAIAALADKVRAYSDPGRKIKSLCGLMEERRGCGAGVLEILQKRFRSLAPSSLFAIERENQSKPKELFEFQPESLHSELVDLFLVAVMTGSDLVTWAVKFTLGHLKDLVRSLTFLVNPELYLPSPPLYLPQPSPDENLADSSHVELRLKISILVRLLLVVFHATGITQEASSWYVRKMEERSDAASKSQTSSVSETRPKSIGLSEVEDLRLPECQVLLSSFRETCAILWMLHAREQVALHARKYQVMREHGHPTDDAALDCLRWLERIKPFAKFLGREAEMQDLVLCLSVELKFDQDVTSLLAGYFYDHKGVHPKVESRFRQVQAAMRKTTIPASNSPRSNNNEENGDLTLQPLTVIFQRQCRIEAERATTNQVRHVFMRESQNPIATLSSTNSATMLSVDLDPSSLEAAFSFESDQAYHKFVARLFDVVLDKAHALRRFAKSRGGKAKPPSKLLVLGNRFQIAMEELNHAASSKEHISRVEKFSSRVADPSTPLPRPRSFSTPKKSALKKASSMGDMLRSQNRTVVVDSPSYRSPSLRRYLSEPEVNESFQQDDDILRSDLAPRCTLLDAADAPTWMKRRLERLAPFMRWLESWSERHVPGGKTRGKSALRLSVTSEELLTALVVAEVRFGKRKYGDDGGSEQTDSQSQEGFSRSVGENEDEVTTVSSIAESESGVADQSEAVISRVVGDHLIDTGTRTSEVEHTDGKSVEEQEDVDELDGTVIKVETLESDEVQVPPQDEKDSTLVGEDLAQQLRESQSDLNADGGSSVQPDGGGKVRKAKPPGAPAPSGAPPGGQDVPTIVRGEIQNVLLAQQVSLLSQILLGQTMTAPQGGAAAQSGNPYLGGVLGGLVLPGVSLPTQQPIPAPEMEPQEPSQEGYYTPRPRDPRKKFGIPLFHVPGITKTQEAKNVELVKTPTARRAWGASIAAKEKRNPADPPPPPKPTRMRLINPDSPDKPLLVRELGKSRSDPDLSALQGRPTPPQGHHASSYAQHPLIDSLPPQVAPKMVTPHNQAPLPQTQPQAHLLKFPSVPHREGAFTSRVPGPAASGAYKTQFPILQAPVAAPQRPQFAPRQAWIPQQQQQATPATFSRVREVPEGRMGPLSRQVIPRLIDPREVLAYEGRKQTSFQSVQKGKILKRGPPVPLMKVEAPAFESHKAPKQTIAKREIEDKENRVPAAEDKLPSPRESRRKTTKVEPQKKENMRESAFEGYLNQDDINHEVELAIDASSDQKMTSADVHLAAALGKRATHKPRMKDAQMQVIVEEPANSSSSEEEEEDYRNKLTTKKLKPPPDIFLKLRLDTDEAAETAVAVQRSGFLHMGDVSAESVRRGIPTAAEQHYKAVRELRPDSTPYAPGFPEPQGEVPGVESILSQHVKEANKVKEVREITRDRWSSAMQQMGAQLDAIDVMSKKMNDDFKSSVRLVDTIDTLGDFMDPKPSKQRPFSPRERRQSSSSSESDKYSGKENVRPRGVARDYRPISPRHSPRDDRYLGPRPYDEPLPTYRPITSDHVTLSRYSGPGDFSTSSSRYKERLKEAYRLSAPDGQFSGEVPGRLSSSSSISVAAMRDEAARREAPFETPYQQPPALPEGVSQSSSSSDSAEEPVYHQEELVRALINDDETTSSKVKPWKQRSEKDRDQVRRWMEQKRRQRTGDYQDRLRALRQAEKKPFRGSTENSGQFSQKRIAEMEKTRERQRKEMLARHHDVRMRDTVNLMEDIKSTKAKTPTKSQRFEKSSLKSSQKKRSPLREANRQSANNETFRISKRSTPYRGPVYSKNNLSLPKDLYRTQQKKSLKSSSRNTTWTSPDPDPLSDVSMSSVMSTWKLNDDVKRILYGSINQKKPFKGHVTFDLSEKSQSSSSSDDAAGARLEDFEAHSGGTASLLADVDWNDVDALISSVEH